MTRSFYADPVASSRLETKCAIFREAPTTRLPPRDSAISRENGPVIDFTKIYMNNKRPTLTCLRERANRVIETSRSSHRGYFFDVLPVQFRERTGVKSCLKCSTKMSDIESILQRGRDQLWLPKKRI